MRPTWSGAVSFGLVNIPVRMYTAAQDRGGLKFHLLHEKDMSPVGYAKVCKAEGTELKPDEIVRGFEYEKDEYVVISEEEFAEANVRKTKTIEILDFVCEDQVDPLYYEKPYYLEPDREADKPYALLLETLRRSQKVGVAKFVLRASENLAVVRPLGNILVLNQIRFAGEVRDVSTLKVPEVEVKDMERELEMAMALVDHMTVPFKPESYRDTYTEELRQVIEARIQGKAPAATGKEPAPTDIRDLMSVLKASLDQSREKQVA